jgi:hypothetical protein
MSALTDFLAAQADADLQLSRRAFSVAQAGFNGGVNELIAEAADISWHGTELHPEAGSIALVREDSDLVDLIGEIIKITRVLPTSTRIVYAYVYATAPIADDISLARRTFMGLGILANELLTCKVETIA